MTINHPYINNESFGLKNKTLDSERIELLLLLDPMPAALSLDMVEHVILRSIYRFCDPNYIERIVVVVPASQIASFERLKANCRFALIVCDQDMLFSASAIPDDVQKVVDIEITFSRLCGTEFYLILTGNSFVTNFISAKLAIDRRMPWGGAPVAPAPGTGDASMTFAGSSFDPVCMSTAIAAKLLDYIIRHPGNIYKVNHRIEIGTSLNSIGFQSRCRHLYWEFLKKYCNINRFYYYHQPYSSRSTLPDMRSQIDLRDHSTSALFCVINNIGSISDAIIREAERLIVTSDDRADQDRGPNKDKVYEFIGENEVRQILLKNFSTWQISFGGVGSNYFANLLSLNADEKEYPLICHFPYPLVVNKENFKAIYIFDDPVLSVISQLNSNHQINIAKNSNTNYSVQWCYGFDLERYATEAKDLFNLEQHFRNWTNPKGPLSKVPYPVLMLRFKACGVKLGTVGKFLGLSEVMLTSLRSQFQFRSRESNVIRDGRNAAIATINEIYAELAAEIRDFPDAAVWDPVSRSVRAA